MIWVGTAITENYVNVSKPYLNSLAKLTNCKKFCVTVGFDWKEGDLDDVSFFNLDKRAISDVAPNYICLQAGDFLNAFDPGDDPIILTDADGLFQRDFTDEERQRFESCPVDTFMMGYNCGAADTLSSEYDRLQPRRFKVAFEKLIGIQLSTIPVYNGGFIVGQQWAWHRIKPFYSSVWKTFYRNFRMKTKTQFLLNLAMYKASINREVLDYDVHSNGHFSDFTFHITDDHTKNDAGLVMYKNRIVLFSHRIDR